MFFPHSLFLFDNILLFVYLFLEGRELILWGIHQKMFLKVFTFIYGGGGIKNSPLNEKVFIRIHALLFKQEGGSQPQFFFYYIHLLQLLQESIFSYFIVI